MTHILHIILVMILIFDIFMATPFGLLWTKDCYDKGKPCYGIIIVFLTAIPALVIRMILGYIH